LLHGSVDRAAVLLVLHIAEGVATGAVARMIVRAGLAASRGGGPLTRRPSTSLRAPWTRRRAAQRWHLRAGAGAGRGRRRGGAGAPAFGGGDTSPLKGCCSGTAVPRQEPKNPEQFRRPVAAGSCAGTGAIRRPLPRWRKNQSRALVDWRACAHRRDDRERRRHGVESGE
jgi:hypothetical protein